ncbi:uncharacterized protein LOC117215803 [Bombus bifarius]|uniref:Uncharacterized protein LOC117215803 n=1 Tax=Bombus bifarius TaxID=103933 RepID=A0A6P8NAN4_9HYME|nr:uncharacterized protein LOC117215803 [Bombus bifarius]
MGHSKFRTNEHALIKLFGKTLEFFVVEDNFPIIEDGILGKRRTSKTSSVKNSLPGRKTDNDMLYQWWSTLLFAGIVSAQINITPLEGNSVFVENIGKGYLYSDTANVIVGLDTSDIYEQISAIESYKLTIDSRAISKQYVEELGGL